MVEKILSETDIRKQVASAVNAIEDGLGKDIDVFNVGEVLGVVEWFIVATANNSRQLKAIVDKVDDALRESQNINPISIEGSTSSGSDWILMDYGDFVVHIFLTEARDFYDLSRLWSDRPRFNQLSDS